MGTSEAEILQSFKTLDIHPDASLDEVRTAFRKIVKMWHPDLYVNSPKLKKIAEEKLKAVNTAYDAIKTYLARRRQPISQRCTEKQTCSPKNRTSQPTSEKATALFSDPFSWLRIRKLKCLLNEYIKCLQAEKPPSYTFRYQTEPISNVNNADLGKDFKQVFQEVAAAGANLHSTNRQDNPLWHRYNG